MLEITQLPLVGAMSLALVLSVDSAAAAEAMPERPNILWLTIEDISPYAFGCYGNDQVQTPTIDQLAKDGVRYAQARATAPQCSPSRATLISGSHATHYGTDRHRREVNVPREQYFFPPHLRAAGYFTTNNYKTDYNASMNGVKVWDESSQTATYNHPDRDAEQPFFAVFNNHSTHMSLLTTVTLNGREPLRLDPAKLDLPPHVPDLPEVRADFALHLEAAENMDKWVALHLEELEKRGLAEDTVIFFYADHGGCLPRGKAFPYETGFHVPLIVWAPAKWRERLGIGSGETSERLVGFEDFASTALSLAGIEPPAHMQGRAFLGEYAQPPKAHQVCFRTNTGIHFDPSRTITDGRFKYIRYFTPYKVHGNYQSFQWQMPAQMAWHDASNQHALPEALREYYLPKPTEALYDLQNDPWELRNLAGDPQYRYTLNSLRASLRDWMRETADLGLFPEPSRYRGKEPDIFTWVRQSNYPLHALQDVAWMASSTSLDDLPRLTALLADSRLEMRFWAAAGFATRARAGALETIPEDLIVAMKDRDPAVAATAAQAVYFFDKRPVALDRLIDLAVANNQGTAYSALMDITAVEGRIEPLLQALDGVDKFSARALRVSMGDLPMSDLYSPQEAEEGLKVYRERLDWRKNLP